MENCPTCAQAMPPEATRATFYYMLDCHMFCRLIGSPDEMVERAVAIIENGTSGNKYPGTYGMLCPAIILAGDVELRKVGPHVHAKTGSPKDIATFRRDASTWVSAINADDVLTALHAPAEGE